MNPSIITKFSFIASDSFSFISFKAFISSFLFSFYIVCVFPSHFSFLSFHFSRFSPLSPSLNLSGFPITYSLFCFSLFFIFLFLLSFPFFLSSFKKMESLFNVQPFFLITFSRSSYTFSSFLHSFL